MKSSIGQTSLFVAVGGLIITEAGIHIGVLQGSFWRVVATGFEAGTIGALADWFAVSALFQKIPLPIIGRHTNIIVKNRPKLTEAIVELVTTQWLSSETIRGKLQGIKISEAVFIKLGAPHIQKLVIGAVRDVLYRFVESIDETQVDYFFRRLFNGRLSDIDIVAPLGTLLERSIQDKSHYPVVENLLNEFVKALDEPATRDLAHEKLKWALDAYGNRDWIKRLVIKVGKTTGGIDVELLTDQVLELARAMAIEAKADPGHPIRVKLDRSLLDLAQKLQQGDPATLEFIAHIKMKIMQQEQLKTFALGLFSRIQDSFIEQLENNDTDFMKFLSNKLSLWVTELQSDYPTQQRLDKWLKEKVAHFVDKYHHEVGNLVRSSLTKLDDRQLVSQIKERVGDDLQYIRLNGAVVGGLVGIIIALIRVFFL